MTPTRSFRVSLLGFAALLATSPALLAQVDARMLRQPDVSQTHITFVYAGDIWIVPKEGGTAQRLSSPRGEESFPRFSPDGRQIAFTGNYDGNQDVYVLPAMGGEPVRVTHHPMADRLLDWYPRGGSLLYASSMESERQRYSQFYRSSPDGGMPEKLPIPYGEFGAVSADGQWLAYTPKSRDFRNWKRYRGGWAPDVWLFNLQTYESRNITDGPANDGQPMWHGETLYFVSDRGANSRYNIWAYDMGRDGMRQVTQFSDFDVRFPAIGPEELVFEAGGRLYLMDLDSEEHREVQVDVVTDRSTLKPRTEDVSRNIASASISPSGKRVVFEARGELFTVPAEHGPIRQLTRTSGFAERFPTWSPDGRWIAYFSDSSGEYELTIRPADGSGEETRVTTLGPGYRYTPQWSPDSESLAFVDKAMQIQIVDRATGRVTPVDKGLWMYEGGLQGFSVSWSADSRWLAYSRGLENRHSAVFIYDTQTGTPHQATSGFYSDVEPSFDPDGKYLYFLSNRNFQPVYSDIDNSWVYPNATNVVAVALRKDVPSPLAPRNDDEEVSEDEESDGEAAADGANGDAGEPADATAAVEIDFDGFEQRLVVLPPEAGNYTGVQGAEGKVLYQRFPRSGSGGDESPLVYFDLGEREEQTVLRDVNGFQVSADGKKVLVASNGRFGIVDLEAGSKDRNAAAHLRSFHDRGSRGGVEADLHRCVALRTRHVLRPDHAWGRLGRDARAVRPTPG